MSTALRSRVFGLGLLFALLFLGLAARLGYLQLRQGEQLERQGVEGSVQRIRLPAPRGVIYDRKGRVLVRNSPSFAVSVVPGRTERPEQAVEELARAMELDAAVRQDLLAGLQSEPYKTIVLKDRLDDRKLARIAELQGEFPQIRLDAQPAREYPRGSLASHLLGYVGEVGEEGLAGTDYQPGDWIGKDGLERSWENLLRGRPGKRTILVNAVGRPMRILGEAAPVSGQDMELTLDMDLQAGVEGELRRVRARLAEKGKPGAAAAAVVLEIDSGKVLALASSPDYHPAWFSGQAPPGKLEALLSDPAAPLLNRAIAGLYSPASTFKMVTGTAAVAEGLADASSSFYCTGSYEVGETPYHCFVRSGHGALSFEEAVAYSCDVAFYDLGVRLGVKRLAPFARSLGLGRPTGIRLPGESAGVFPDGDYKRALTGEAWYAGDDANLAIGQGYLMVTPLQMAVLTAAIANGGTVYRPQLLNRVVPGGPQPARVVSKLELDAKVFETIRAGMIGAVTYGTATRAYAPWGVAGKTGTVENSPSADNPEGRNHTWFACYSPVDKPRIAVVVLVEKSGGYGGEVAAPVARNIVEVWHRLEEKSAFQSTDQSASRFGVRVQPQGRPGLLESLFELPPGDLRSAGLGLLPGQGEVGHGQIVARDG